MLSQILQIWMWNLNQRKLNILSQISSWKFTKTVRQLIVIIFFKSLSLHFFFRVIILPSVCFSFIIFFVFWILLYFFFFTFLTPQTVQIHNLIIFHQRISCLPYLMKTNPWFVCDVLVMFCLNLLVPAKHNLGHFRSHSWRDKWEWRESV